MGRASSLKEFSASLQRVGKYPTNLIATDSYPHRLHAYLARLNEAEPKLCCEEDKALLGFWTCEEEGCGFQSDYVGNVDELGHFYQIDTDFFPGLKDPRCCFAFIRARNSRDRLLISRPMMSLLFTYNQVLPAFLDFVLTFGRRERAQELHYGGFRSESRLLNSSNGMRVPELGRSGRDFRLCYNLKSVERSPSQKHWPWSVRQIAIHHSFDIVTGRASWIIVKGDDLMENRVKEATDPAGCTDTSRFDTNSRSFASSLNTHLIYIDWAGENWQTFIDYLEDEAQGLTRRVLSADVDSIPKSLAAATSIAPTPKITKRTSSGFSSLFTEKDPQVLETPSRPRSKLLGRLRQMTDLTLHGQQKLQERSEGVDESEDRKFCFGDLQRAQYLEEKTNGAILVISIILSVIGEIKNFYQELLRTGGASEELGPHCINDLERFLRRTSSAENDLLLQKSRAESLVQVLADRKELLFGVLEFRNMEASRLSAQSMHAVAQQTQQETVSMRIITLVTLLFLPATFICTLMSTDIIRWGSEDGGHEEKAVSTGAIKFFFAITLPLSFCTFSAWWYFHRRLARAQKGNEGAVCPV